MAISVSTLQHNMMAMNAGRMYGSNSKSIAKTTEKLSSGYAINRAADDAAGLAISEKMRRQIRGLTQASANTQDGISLVQTADGALTESHQLVQRINELAVQAANGTLTEEDRGYIQSEVSALGEEIDRIANTTTFNGDIYPLRGEQPENSFGIDVVEDYTYYMRNESGVDQTLDGKPWPVGSTVAIAGIQMNTNTMVGSTLYYIHMNDGMGTKGPKYPDIVNSANVGTYYNGCYSLRKSDLKVDEEGYIYFDSKVSGSKMYIIRDLNAGENMYSRTSTKGVSGWDYMKYDPILPNIWIQASSEGNNGIELHGVDATAMGLGLHPLDVSTEESARATIDAAKRGIAKISEYRSYFGSSQNRMEHTIKNLDNVVENTTEAESRIRDTDMAAEMMSLSLKNILSQASTNMMAQANQIPEGVLSLLQ